MTSHKSTAFPLFRAISSAAVLLGLVACATPQPDAVATADLQSTRGNAATGTVRFAQTGDKVMVTGEVRGLKPNAEHGFHVHEKGDCSSGDGMSTGGHFNPGAAAHGQHGQGAHHVGDMPSLKADAQGVAKIDFSSTSLTLKPGASSIVGKGLIVHRDPDDYKTQPTGNAGPRVACAVIRAS
jgi:superoxide dismutase, Cu-Zn family